jgi:hypothetical protein
MSAANIEEQQAGEIKKLEELLQEACAILFRGEDIDDFASFELRKFAEEHEKKLFETYKTEYRKLVKEVPKLREAASKAHQRLAYLEANLGPDVITEIQEEF